MLLGVVVDPARQPADGSFFKQPVEGQVDRFPASQVEKISGDVNRTPTPAIDARKDFIINALCRFCGTHLVRNIGLFFLQVNPGFLPRFRRRAVLARHDRREWQPGDHGRPRERRPVKDSDG